MAGVKVIEGATPDQDTSEEPTGLEAAVSAAGSAPAIVSGDLQRDADKLIREYLETNAASIMGISDPAVKKVFGYFSARGIVVSPGRNQNTNYNYLQYSFPETLALEDARDFFKSFVGDYVQELDIYRDSQLLTNPSTLAEFVPELGSLLKRIASAQMTQAYPYTLVMGMKPEVRALPTVALGKREQVVPFLVDHTLDEVPLLRTHCIPTFQEMVKVAEEYKSKDLKPVLEALKEVRELYASTFGMSI